MEGQNREFNRQCPPLLWIDGVGDELAVPIQAHGNNRGHGATKGSLHPIPPVHVGRQPSPVAALKPLRMPRVRRLQRLSQRKTQGPAEEPPKHHAHGQNIPPAHTTPGPGDCKGQEQTSPNLTTRFEDRIRLPPPVIGEIDSR